MYTNIKVLLFVKCSVLGRGDFTFVNNDGGATKIQQ